MLQLSARAWSAPLTPERPDPECHSEVNAGCPAKPPAHARSTSLLPHPDANVGVVCEPLSPGLTCFCSEARGSQEMAHIRGMSPDYMTSLLGRPAELARVVEQRCYR